MWKKNSLWILALTITSILCVGGINWFVNPYSVFGTINDYSKNEIGSHLRLFKAVGIRHQNAKILLFGDSEIERGIDSELIRSKLNKTIYNASFSSMQIYELRKYLELALQHSKPEYVIIGLQMYDFGSTKYADDYKEEYVDNNFNPYKLILSIDTLKSSKKTILQKMQNKQPDRSKSGLMFDFSTENLHDRFIANEKHYIIDNAPKLNEFKYKNGESTFNEYEKILKTCHKNNIKLIIFISPSHARQYEATDVGNGWTTFESWKKQLVLLNEKIAVVTNTHPYPLWDFSGYNQFTAEEIPTEKNVKMKYYYESSHYTPALGNILISRLFDSNSSSKQKYSDFGIKLTGQNIGVHLAQLRLDRAKWRATHTKDIAEIEALKVQ